MAEKRLIDLIRDNKAFYELLIELGQIPLSKKNDYRIFCHFESLDINYSKMDRYVSTSESLKVSEKTVRNAIKSMNSII